VARSGRKGTVALRALTPFARVKPLRLPRPDDLREALALPAFDGRAAQRLVEPADRGPVPPGSRADDVRAAAALCYVFADADGRLVFPLTRRHAALREQPGQIALPGGRPEPGEALAVTAWREAEEEIGLVRAEGAELLGVLDEVYIAVTHTRLLVHVALGPAPARLQAAPDEVDAIGLAGLDELLDPSRRVEQVLVLRGTARPIPHLHLGPFEVWGATAMALADLGARLRVVLGARP
jgi:8-oxo-dGTP pyrophosphatase MutT (NUDIX family)